jgi:outer membrane murein-binding lipoprotein Lpp
MKDRKESTGERSGLTRRELLVAGAAVATAILAGCSDITEHSFESRAVTLSDERQSELQLRELTAESQTTEREAAGAEITITNNVAVYRRSEWLATEGGE